MPITQKYIDEDGASHCSSVMDENTSLHIRQVALKHTVFLIA